ncbi:diguanylate cyclase [Gorillibacterium sp. sgz5001074]|uniref:diguanylate cyclase n=1 Tax=Gorillibacterium sp. sgz5001074 TaxID=3446695 RepID=UPI003F6722FA
MESHRYGLQGPDTDRSMGLPAADSRLFGPRFIPLTCNCTAERFSSDREWIKLACDAFQEWSAHMEAVTALGQAVWFVSDAAGSWIHARSPVRTVPGSMKEELSGHVRRFTSGGAVFDDELLPAGGRLAMAALRTGDSETALVLGWYWGGEPTAVDGQGLFHLAAGYPAYLNYLAEREAGVRLTQERQSKEREASKKELLFQMANELYSKIDTDEILSEIVKRIRYIYPDCKIDLLMTQDQHSTNLEVKPLRFVKQEEDLCTKAFMEGRIVTGRGPFPGKYEMAVPISGKQGIYGVLHIHSHEGSFDSFDAQLLKVLSVAAGSAFENAKLYEQSNVLVSELRLINELTKRLNQSLKLNEIFNFASAELTKIFHADFCCILQLDKERHEFVVQSTNVAAMLFETFEENYGYAGVVFASKEPVIVSDYGQHPSAQSKLMQVTGSRSLIAAPLLVHDEVQGVILVSHRVPGYFTYDNYKLLQVLAGHIGLALANASLHAEVRRMVITDTLTGLYARHYLDEQVGLNQKKDFCGSLIVVDIDHFKSVNDTYGHQVGDTILVQVSRIIRTSIRDSDIAARWGGEELAVYLPQVTTEQALRIAERIRSRVEEETNPCVTVSCGVSEWNWEDDKISVENLFYRSDMALYKAKHEGRNRVMVG